MLLYFLTFLSSSRLSFIHSCEVLFAIFNFISPLQSVILRWVLNIELFLTAMGRMSLKIMSQSLLPEIRSKNWKTGKTVTKCSYHLPLPFHCKTYTSKEVSLWNKQGVLTCGREPLGDRLEFFGGQEEFCGFVIFFQLQRLIFLPFWFVVFPTSFRLHIVLFYHTLTQNLS